MKGGSLWEKAWREDQAEKALKSMTCLASTNCHFTQQEVKGASFDTVQFIAPNLGSECHL